jgi:N-hydroxyarylamine O-acetyltransferase
VTDWGTDELDLDAYLERIGVAEPTLRSVHAGHVASIPFENIDVALGEVPALDLPSLQDKLVRRQRGGYCYEQNLLYAAALERLGITVSRQAARTRAGTTEIRPRTHMMLLATVDGEDYLTDVGWGGGGLLEPMPLRQHTVRQGAWTYRLVLDDGLWQLQTETPEGWQDLYAFAIERQYPADYAMFNFYTATYPRSPFAGRLVLQLARPDLRYALLGNELITAGPDGVHDKQTLTPEEILAAVRDRFGIELTDDERARLARVLSH